MVRPAAASSTAGHRQVARRTVCRGTRRKPFLERGEINIRDNELNKNVFSSVWPITIGENEIY